MKVNEVLIKLEGLHTIPTVMKSLGVNRQQATYYIHRLRKQGYVKTTRDHEGRRIYRINKKNRLGGISYTELLNKDSPIKLAESQVHMIYGNIPSHEEILIHAIKKANVRYLLSALSQFKKIDDWSLLYQLAKKENVVRQVGALYDLARKVMKVRRMPKRFRNNALPKKETRKKYIVQKLFSKDFKSIEDEWKIHIPLNTADLEEYTYDKHRRPKRAVISNLKRAE